MEENISLLNMQSGKALDVLGKILPHMEAILSDPEYIRIKERMQADKELTTKDIIGDAFMAIAMKNRKAVYGIVGAVTGKTEKEVEEQPLIETIAVLKGATGNEVLGFFTFFALMAVRM
jgi:hypothetical protein